MARIKSSLAKALTLYLVLMPLIGMRAEARPAPRPIAPPRPGGPPRPDAGGDALFRAAAEPLTIRAFNGFSSEVTPGFFRHKGHTDTGGVATVVSPWGEELKIRYWLSPHGVTFEYDDDLRVVHRFDEDGSLAEIAAVSPSREARTTIDNRAELAYLGQRDWGSFDMSAYVVIEESMRAKHSDAFLAGLARFDGPARVSCTTNSIQCAACILVWALSVAAITNACVVGGVITFGAACLVAILGHEATSFSCAATCIEAWEDCLVESADKEPHVLGCEDP
jgi:hypothetical protein